MARTTFPLRFTRDRVREAVRRIAEQEGISQNELLEQAAEHEVVARGALLADELEASAAHLRKTAVQAMRQVVEASLEEFADAEAYPEPLRPRKVEGLSSPTPSSRIGAVAAFHRS
jgi:chromosomal replication initiation ATPase DnaA